jgi:hypothetical protein
MRGGRDGTEVRLLTSASTLHSPAFERDARFRVANVVSASFDLCEGAVIASLGGLTEATYSRRVMMIGANA